MKAKIWPGSRGVPARRACPAGDRGRRANPLALLLALALALCPFVAPGFSDQSQPPKEYAVKAAFLLNFARFVEWPARGGADEGSPFNICILGNDPFGSVLDQIVEGENVNGRKLAVKRLKKREEGAACQVAFIAKSESNPLALAELGKGVLTVGEGEGFLRDGGMIAFSIDNRRVRFDVNLGAAQSGSLKLSSKLLAVARSVEK